MNEMPEKDKELLVASAPTRVEFTTPVSDTEGEEDVEASDPSSVIVVMNGSSYTVTVGLVWLHDQDAVVVMSETMVPFVVESEGPDVEIAAAVLLLPVRVESEGVIVTVMTDG